MVERGEGGGGAGGGVWEVDIGCGGFTASLGSFRVVLRL